VAKTRKTSKRTDVAVSDHESDDNEPLIKRFRRKMMNKIVHITIIIRLLML